MVKLINAEDRHFSSAGWLKSHFLFSFADYYDPTNMQFGPLRVFNDDYVAPKSGFPQHPHSEMEIITIVLDGEVTHEDSMGNKTIISTGDVQRMTAGTGITHSETNNSDKELHLLQLWFLTNKRALNPSYEQKHVDFHDSKNELIPLVTGQKVLEDVVFMNSNSTVYYSYLKKDKEIDFKTFEIRKTLIYVLEGELFANGMQATANDQLRIDDESAILIRASQDSSFILIDVPAVEANY
ncbi:pirin family protein [Adhaeribacter radiodurans]|uniref:Pirin family protein n=1 Tax=Adhaeribacter radiodurans TaxID=2745197 RepID=A0A7L7L6S6_9BACT|nr:pirin-like bicupin family protein [Adhaeribacter radiodurans]QMU28483.1 pirin family protein [Adhaeribacter radiodurans]